MDFVMILVDLVILMISGVVEVVRTDTTTLTMLRKVKGYLQYTAMMIDVHDEVFRRVRRQIPRDIKQGCTTTGYEKRIRELCEEVLETICKVRGASMF